MTPIQVRCGLFPHNIKGTPMYITDERLISFAKKLRTEFRPEYEVCRACYNSMLKVYNKKKASAIKKLKERRKQSGGLNISNPSTSNSSNDKTKALSTTTTSSSTAETVIFTASQSQSNVGSQQQLQLSESPLDMEPSTSAAANLKRLNKAPAPTSSAAVWDAGIAVLNGSRLPHIQPIPKRQIFVHANKDVMDIYLAGTTGG